MDAQIKTVALGEEQTMRTADQLLEELNSALQDNCVVLIDTSAVERIDVAGLQVLIAAKRSARAANKICRIDIAEDSVVAKALRDSGLTADKACPLRVSAARDAQHSVPQA